MLKIREKIVPRNIRDGYLKVDLDVQDVEHTVSGLCTFSISSTAPRGPRNNRNKAAKKGPKDITRMRPFF
jgi:hypothetical protein